MIKLELLLGTVAFAIWVFALIDVLSTPEPVMRGLPKIGWVVVVVIFQVIGALAWFVMGRPENRGARPLSAHERSTPAFPEYDRPGRAAAGDPEKDEEFLRQIRARAEEQRKRYEAEKRKPQEPTPEA